MFVWNTYPRIQLLARQKLQGGGKHYGVHFSINGSVLDLTVDGVRHSDLKRFSECRPVEVVYVAPVSETENIMRRAHEALSSQQEYRFFVWNCEHFANWVVGKPPESAQINSALVISLGLLLLRTVTK